MVVVAFILVVITLAAYSFFNTEARINRALNRLSETRKVIVRSFETTSITDESVIKEIIDVLSNAIPPNCNIFGFTTASGPDLGLDMLNNQGEIIESINIWTSTNGMMPKSIKRYCGRTTIDITRLNDILEEASVFHGLNSE